MCSLKNIKSTLPIILVGFSCFFLHSCFNKVHHTLMENEEEISEEQIEPSDRRILPLRDEIFIDVEDLDIDLRGANIELPRDNILDLINRPLINYENVENLFRGIPNYGYQCIARCYRSLFPEFDLDLPIQIRCGDMKFGGIGTCIFCFLLPVMSIVTISSFLMTYITLHSGEEDAYRTILSPFIKILENRYEYIEGRNISPTQRGSMHFSKNLAPSVSNQVELSNIKTISKISFEEPTIFTCSEIQTIAVYAKPLSLNELNFSNQKLPANCFIDFSNTIIKNLTIYGSNILSSIALPVGLEFLNIMYSPRCQEVLMECANCTLQVTNEILKFNSENISECGF